MVGTCPSLEILPPLRRPLSWLAAHRSRRLAAAQSAAVAAAGGHPVSLAALLNPYFEADIAGMFGADRFHPSATGYARAVAVSLPTMMAALTAEGVLRDDHTADYRQLPSPSPGAEQYSLHHR